MVHINLTPRLNVRFVPEADVGQLKPQYRYPVY